MPPSKGPVIPERAGGHIPVVNTTHMHVVTLSWQLQPPQDALVVVVKGSFDVVPGAAARPREQSELPTGERMVDDDPDKSCIQPSDYAVLKPKADVLLLGHAYAPGGKATASRAALGFGHPGNRIDKAIIAVGPRRWQRSVLGATPTEPEPFDRIALLYENAFGGPKHALNPWGKGHGDDESMPSLELSDHAVASPRDTHPPACFAPLPMQWASRWRKLGSYDRAWLRERWPYFAVDFDWSFYQDAPEDQQLAHLRGDEPFELEGVHAEHRVLRGTLPALAARCFALERPADGGRLKPVPLVLDTVVLRPDEMALDLVWRGRINVTADDAPEIRALFVTTQPIGEPELDVDQASALLVAALTPLEPVVDVETGDPANEVEEKAPTVEESQSASDVDAGAAPDEDSASDEAAPGEDDTDLPLPPPPEPEAIAVTLREAGASEEEVAAVLEALAPPPLDEEPAAPPLAPIRARVEAMLATDQPFDGFDFEEGDLSDLDFSGRSLRAADMLRARFCRARFDQAVLSEAQMGSADCTGASFVEADLAGADLTDATLDDACLDNAELSAVAFTGASAKRASFREARGRFARFDRADLSGAHFERATLPRADLTEACLDEARFDGADMASLTLYDAHGERLVLDGARLHGLRAEGAVLPEASFVAVEAPDSVLENVTMDGARWHGADLRGSSLLRAVCRKGDFRQAVLTEARLDRADLAGSSFVRANLMMASCEATNLSLTDLREANLHAAGLWKAKLEHARLDGAIVTKSTLVMRPI